eukprot:10124139-Karenia_brevis.AAC.1
MHHGDVPHQWRNRGKVARRLFTERTPQNSSNQNVSRTSGGGGGGACSSARRKAAASRHRRACYTGPCVSVAP